MTTHDQNDSEEGESESGYTIPGLDLTVDPSSLFGDDEQGDSTSQSPYRGGFLERTAYTIFGEYFRNRSNSYGEFNRVLNQARIPVSYDVYLSRTLFYGLAASLGGASMGLFLTFFASKILVALGVGVTLPAQVAELVQQNELLIKGGLITAVLTFLTFAGVVGWMYYYPYYIAGERKRELNAMLPHAITYCYAMSRGGVSILEVMRSLSRAEDTYGEVANEFQAIINNVDYVQEDLRTAVREEAAITPSDNMQEFLEDLLSVIDSGSDMESFFLNKSELYLQRVRDQQRQTLEVLELMSEAYVTIFVASPIFVLVILLVMSMMGGTQLVYLYVMTYFGLPMGALFFVSMVKIINMSPAAGGEKLDRGLETAVFEPDVDHSKIKDDPRYKKYQRENFRRRFLKSLTAPVYQIRESPLLTLAFTIPATVSFIYWAYAAELVGFSMDAMSARPVWQSAILALIPIYIICAPISLVYELERRREKAILQKLPEAFKSASDANDRGLDLEESFRIVAENSEGALAQELGLAFRQAQWTGDIGDSLASIANSLRVPRLSRTVKLITEANYSSGDIQSVLDVAARDVENMHELDKERRQNAVMYLIIIAVSFLIALGVISMLDMAFLSAVADQASSASSSNGSSSSASGMSSGPGLNSGLPVMKFRMAFLHTTMVLGFTAGIVIGSMANDSAISGLKYALIMMTIAISVFLFV